VGLILSIFANPNIIHGPLETLITSNEEVGMIGAKK
jgi:hypothetical protein